MAKADSTRQKGRINMFTLPFDYCIMVISIKLVPRRNRRWK